MQCLTVNFSGHVGSDDEGPFRFDCNALEVKLSPRSRQRETGNAAADATFEALLADVRVRFAPFKVPQACGAFSMLRKCFCSWYVFPFVVAMSCAVWDWWGKIFDPVFCFIMLDNTLFTLPMIANIGFRGIFLPYCFQVEHNGRHLSAVGDAYICLWQHKPG